MDMTAEPMRRIFSDRVSDTLQVLVPNGAVLGVINLIELKTCAEITLLALSIAYTLWRWRRDAKKKGT